MSNPRSVTRATHSVMIWAWVYLTSPKPLVVPAHTGYHILGIDPVNNRQLVTFIFSLLHFNCLYTLPQRLSRIVAIAPWAGIVFFCLLVQLDTELCTCYLWEEIISFSGHLLHIGSNLAITPNNCVELYLWLQRRSLCLHHLYPSWGISVGSHCSKHLTLSWSLHWHLLDAGLVCSLISFKI